METLQVLWRILSRWSKCIKLFSHLWLSQIKLCWGTFYTFLCFDTFLFSSISWKPFNWLTSFFTDILDIAQRVTSLKKSFQFSLFESCSASYLMKFCTFVLFITLTVNVLRKICSMYPSTRDLLTYFGYILQCLDKLKTFLWYFSQISWYYCDGH